MTLGERGRAAPAFFPLFDGLRAIAALLVVVVHAAFISGFTTHQGMWGALTARGEIGVSVFFLISGFLLYRPWAAAHLRDSAGPKTQEFFVRRALRIVPLYWVALTVFFLLDRFAGVQATGPKGIADLPVYFLFGQVYSKEHVLHGLTPAWTLCIEVTFYLLLPLYAAALARGRRNRTPSQQLRREFVGLALVVVIALSWRSVTLLTAGSMSNVVRAWLPSYADQFALGMLLAVASVWFRQTGQEPSAGVPAVLRRGCVAPRGGLLPACEQSAGGVTAGARLRPHAGRGPVGACSCTGRSPSSFFCPLSSGRCGRDGYGVCSRLRCWLSWA